MQIKEIKFLCTLPRQQNASEMLEFTRRISHTALQNIALMFNVNFNQPLTLFFNQIHPPKAMQGVVLTKGKE